MRTRPALYLATILGCLAFGMLVAGPAYAGDHSRYAGIEDDDPNPLTRYDETAWSSTPSRSPPTARPAR